MLLDAARETAKLADFGSSRVAAAGGGGGLDTGGGGGGGGRYTGGCVTGWYRAPEVMLGDPDYGATLHGLDAWAGGCVLVEMASLAPAFPADTEVHVRLVGGGRVRGWEGRPGRVV